LEHPLTNYAGDLENIDGNLRSNPGAVNVPLGHREPRRRTLARIARNAQLGMAGFPKLPSVENPFLLDAVEL
jgi:hypothetical protein